MNVKKKIRKAFENATPDVLGSVLSDCQLEKGTVIEMKEKKKSRKILEFAATAAAVVLLFGVGAGIASLVAPGISVIPGSTQSSSGTRPSTDGFISEEDAFRIAESYTQDLYPTVDGEILSTVVLDSQNSVYNVTVLYGGYAHEYEIDAVTGQFMSTQIDPIDQTLGNGYIGMIAARDIALENMNTDLDHVQYLDVDFLQRDDICIYTVECKFNHICAYSIDAVTGEILSFWENTDTDAFGLNLYELACDVSWQEARDIALKDANIPLSDLTGLNFLSASPTGSYTFTFTVGCIEYEYMVHEKTGYILKSEKGKTDNSDPFFIYIQNAIKIAQYEAGISADMLTDLKTEYESGIYEIEFGDSQYHYTAYVSSYTGSIVYFTVTEPEAATDEAISDLIGRHAAKNYAFAHAGVTADQLTALSIEYGNESGIEYYIIKFTESSNEYKYKIHARSAAIMDYSKNGQGVDTPPNEKLTAEEALSIIVDSYYGLNYDELSDIVCAFVDDSENPHYDISFRRHTYEYEAQVHAYSGERLKSGWMINLEGASIEDLLWTPGTWYNMALTSDYETPADINLYYFFYGGFEDESSTPTDAESAYLDSKLSDTWVYMGIDRLPTEKMDAILQEYFGISLEQTNGNGLDHFLYWTDTDCYYHICTDANYAQIEIERVEQQPDGTICVYYLRDYPEAEMVVTLKPTGDGYQILSNLPTASA